MAIGTTGACLGVDYRPTCVEAYGVWLGAVFVASGARAIAPGQAMLLVDEGLTLIGRQVETRLPFALLHRVDIKSHDRQGRVGMVRLRRLVGHDARYFSERSSTLLQAVDDDA